MGLVLGFSSVMHGMEDLFFGGGVTDAQIKKDESYDRNPNQKRLDDVEENEEPRFCADCEASGRGDGSLNWHAVCEGSRPQWGRV